jgi:hypothetical protein
MDHADAPVRRRNSDASSERSEDEDRFPADVANGLGYTQRPHEAFPPRHSTGHTTPGHVVGRPLQDSPKNEDVKLPPEIARTEHTKFPDIVSKVRRCWRAKLGLTGFCLLGRMHFK